MSREYWEIDYRQPRGGADNGCCGECYQLGQPCCVEEEPLYRIVYSDGHTGRARSWPWMLKQLRRAIRSTGPGPVRVVRELRL